MKKNIFPILLLCWLSVTSSAFALSPYDPYQSDGTYQPRTGDAVDWQGNQFNAYDPTFTDPSASSKNDATYRTGNSDYGSGNTVGITNPLAGKADDLVGLINYLVGIVKVVAIPVATLVFIYGAYQLLIGGANAEMLKKGKKTILYAVVGLAIVLLAQALVGILKEIVG